MKQASGQTIRLQCSQDWDRRCPTIEKMYRTQVNLKQLGASTRVKAGEMKTTLRVQRRRQPHGKETRSNHHHHHNRKAMARMAERLLKTEDISLPLIPSVDAITTSSAPSPEGSTTTKVAERPSAASTNAPLTANHWADMLVSSIHELRNAYGRLETPPQHLPSFLEVIDFDDENLASRYEPTAALYTQTMQHVAG